MITIRKIDLKDAKRLSELLNNKKILDNLRNQVPYPYSYSDAVDFITFVEKNEDQHVFAIEFKEDFCGVVALIKQQDVYEKSGEIGYWIGEPYWGRGIASKAVELITKYGFEKLYLIRLFAGVFENNIASMKVLEKNGYSIEGKLKNAVVKNGAILDEYRYYKLKEVM